MGCHGKWPPATFTFSTLTECLNTHKIIINTWHKLIKTKKYKNVCKVRKQPHRKKSISLWTASFMIPYQLDIVNLKQNTLVSASLKSSCSNGQCANMAWDNKYSTFLSKRQKSDTTADRRKMILNFSTTVPTQLSLYTHKARLHSCTQYWHDQKVYLSEGFKDPFQHLLCDVEVKWAHV